MRHFPLELHDQPHKNADEEQLQSDTAHIDVDSLQLLGGWSRRTCIASTNNLNDEGYEIQRDKCQREGRCWYREKGVSWEEKLDEAAHEHIVKGVDPCLMVSALFLVSEKRKSDAHSGARRINISKTR